MPLEDRGYSFQHPGREPPSFNTVDYVLFALTLAVSASIGFYYAWADRRKKNIKDFLMAGGEMRLIHVALSLLTCFIYTITLLGTPGEMYRITTTFWLKGISYFFVVFGVAHVCLTAFYNIKVRGAYQEPFIRLLIVLLLMQFIGAGAEDPNLHICMSHELFYKIILSNTTLQPQFVILKVPICFETIFSTNDRFYSTDQLIAMGIVEVVWKICFIVSVILVLKFSSENHYNTNITKSNVSIGTDNTQKINQTKEE